MHMKSILRLAALSLSLAISGYAGTPLGKETKVGGFSIGCQAYSFNQFSAYEAIDKTAAAGGKTIEFFSWQKLSPENPKLEVNSTLSDKHIAELKEKLKSAGLRATSMYFGNKAFEAKDPEAELRKTFDFAKKMNFVALTGEPPLSGFDLVEKLCKEYDLRFCLHNHRKDDSHPDYKNWDPNYTASIMKGRDKHMGFCLDTGHLVRSGLNPLDALQILKGRVYSLHLKDPISADGHDTVYGQGVGDVQNVLKELKKQKFNGFISIEYENFGTNSVSDIKQCIDFVRDNAKKL
jgi:sugar phosphate isomerase/epimerase